MRQDSGEIGQIWPRFFGDKMRERCLTITTFSVSRMDENMLRLKIVQADRKWIKYDLFKEIKLISMRCPTSKAFSNLRDWRGFGTSQI